MKQYNREKNKLRPYISSHKIILRNNKKEFKKIYLGKKSNFSTKKVIKNEYFKTLKAHKLGISPKPLSYKDTELIIKYLPIKKNFKQLIEQNKLTNKLILSLAKKIAILHKNNIIHEDLSFTNVVLDTNNKLFIIDFSPGYFGRGNAGRYSDLGAIIASLRYFKPLYKPHLFFKMKKYNEFAKIFLKEYIKNYGFTDLKKVKKEELKLYKSYPWMMLAHKSNIITFIFWFFFSKIIYVLEKNKKYY